MPQLTAGSAFPQDVTFSYIPYTPEIDSVKACGIPQNYKASTGTSSHPISPCHLPRNTRNTVG